MKTGNTAHRRRHALIVDAASMEPGHEDREYGGEGAVDVTLHAASMEPGHEDREYGSPATARPHRRCCLNGARS